jgi:hypothetical protein
MKKTPWILAVVVLVLSTSCHKSMDKPVPPPTPTGPFLYVGGGIPNGQGIYWKSQLNHPELVVDTVKNGGVITDMVSADDGLYFAARTGGYWKNDSFITVPNALQVVYLAVAGGTVYSAGFSPSIGVAFWVGNVENDLGSTYGRARYPNQSLSEIGVTGIAVSGNNVYVAGSLYFDNYPGTPDSVPWGNFALLWTNDNLQPLTPGAYVNLYYQSTAGVATVDNDVYVAGHYPDTTFAGGYWKNGVWNSIANGSFLPSAIVTNGSSICMPGNYWARGNPTTGAAYWLDGKLVPLGGAYAIAATFFGHDVYIAGIDNNSNIVVWKNGAIFETIGPAAGLEVTSIAIR